MKKRIIVYLVIFELVIIVAFVFAIFKKNEPTVSLNPLNLAYLVNNPVYGLKHFYEPKPNIVWSVDPKFLQTLGYSYGSNVSFHINKDSLNQEKNYPTEKQKGIYRIATIGDSFTFGLNVNTKDNYPSQLEVLLNRLCTSKKISKFEIINLGLQGYDIQYTVERYRLRGQKYNPDLVLWLLIGDDFRRINELQQPQKDFLSKYVAPKNFGLFNDLYSKMQSNVINSLGGEKNLLTLQYNHLTSINDYFKNKLVLFSSPLLNKQYEELILKFSKARKDTYFYKKVPDIYSDDLYHLNDNHPTKEGYTVIVNDLFNYLTKNKIIPCDTSK